MFLGARGGEIRDDSQKEIHSDGGEKGLDVSEGLKGVMEGRRMHGILSLLELYKQLKVIESGDIFFRVVAPGQLPIFL